MQVNRNIDIGKERDISVYAKRQKKGFKSFEFKLGMNVMKKNAKQIGRKGDRLQPRWIGGYVVTAISGSMVVITNHKTGRALKAVNIAMLKPYVERSKSEYGH